LWERKIILNFANRKQIVSMCTYNISIEEDVMEKVRPSIANGVSEDNKNRVYLENGEVKFNIVTDYLSIEEAKEFTKKAIDLEYSLP
jgi:hypothetical protein